MFLMEDKELENWKKVRAKGARSYIIKTSVLAYAIVFFIHVVVNGFLNIDEIDKYISYNMARLDKLAIISGISIVILIIFTSLFWRFNERRYKATIEK